MIIADIVTALRMNGYKVDTTLVNKTGPRHVSVVLGAFEPQLETALSYLPEVEIEIIFYMIDGDEAVTQIKDIITILHQDDTLKNYHHFKIDKVNINPTKNDIEVSIVLQYREVINLG